MKTDEFDFDLPPHLIAQHPPEQRGGSRLLHLHGQQLTDYPFSAFIQLVNPGDVLVLNDTRVIKARLHGCKSTGGKIEVMVERILNTEEILAQIKASHAPKPGSLLTLADAFTVEVIGRENEFFKLKLHTAPPALNILDLLDQYGQLPLPPYIEHPTQAQDEQRYQTVFAREDGAVAAPTAGLHFTEEMLQQLTDKGIQTAYLTLHVGAGTFQPVRSEQIEHHKMHSECYHIPQRTVDLIHQAKTDNKRIISIGTTSLRALESAALAPGQLQAGAGETSIFITPGYQFKIIDLLLTNFHLPRSTLLMLVSAFAGIKPIQRAYQHAVEQQYRFFSYGDAMLLEPNQES